jgi:DNA-binding MarR family transcriptional regulator
MTERQPPEEIFPETHYRALAEFRYQIRRFVHFSERIARGAGLEPQQHQLLLAIKGLPESHEPTIGELAERLQLQHHSAAELIDRTEARGLVHRARGDADRRQVFVELTPTGERLLRRLSLHHRDELQSAGPSLAAALASIISEPLPRAAIHPGQAARR